MSYGLWAPVSTDAMHGARGATLRVVNWIVDDPEGVFTYRGAITVTCCVSLCVMLAMAQ